ncbi:MAG: glycine--tRNA ligase [Bacteroidia bacterium]|nr:glycine--tRNA ligase [Bacteroidia bacterium]
MQYDASLFPKLIAHAKEHGFVFQSSEIYDGLSAVYDYGPLGVLLKNNLRELWWKSMVQLHANIVGLDAAILMHPTVWKASGHVDAFSDPLIDNKDSKRRYRADQLIEDHIAKLLDKARKDTEKKFKKEGREDVPADEFQRRMGGDRNAQKATEIQARFEAALGASDWPGLRTLIEEADIVDPDTGSRNWTDVRQFNLMFRTQLGAMAEGASDVYLRPETAQGIFVNFLNVQRSQRLKLPFGIAQVGKAFRNEIVARQFIFRMREFEQMELQFFIKPGTQREWFDYWRETRLRWHHKLGLAPARLHLHPHTKLAHYADAAVDIEFEFPFGFKELEGIHSRTDYDLSRHEEFSGKKLRYFDPDTNESFVPYVVETSVGLDRCFLTHLCNAYSEEPAPTADGEEALRTVLKLHPLVAPIKAAILPLVNKDGMPEIAEKLRRELATDFMVVGEDKDTIGRRYRRMDAKGVPFCVTIDSQTLADETVTLRHRDTMAQERIALSQVHSVLQSALSPKAFFAE